MPYTDTICTQTRYLDEYNTPDDGIDNPPGEFVCVGQVRVDRRRKPTSAFMITQLVIREYPDGSKRYRVNGFLSGGPNGIGSHDRSLDMSSMMKMFPYVKFDTKEEERY